LRECGPGAILCNPERVLSVIHAVPSVPKSEFCGIARKQPRRQRPQPLKHACSPGKSREQDTKQRWADPTDDKRSLLHDKVKAARPHRRHPRRARRGAGRHKARGGGPGRGGLLRLCTGLPKRGGGLKDDLAVDASHVLVADVQRVLSAGHVVVLRHVLTPVVIGQRPGQAHPPILRAFQAQFKIFNMVYTFISS